MTSIDIIEKQKFNALFSKISSYDFGNVLKKYIRDHEESKESADEVLLELKRWLTLCAMYPTKQYVTGSKVDDMWHTFILFTREYIHFCQEITGSYIHHCPEIWSDNEKSKEESGLKLFAMAKLLDEDYVKHFDSHPPHHIWPIPTRHGSGAGTCNTYCHTCFVYN